MMDFRAWTVFGCALLMAFSIGCGEATDVVDEPLDPENEAFGVDGRADSLNGLGQDEIDKILAIANSYSLEELDAFLNVRAARSIIYMRDRRGAFESLAELDAVAWVGRSALEAFRVEAQSFEGIAVVTDPREMVEVREVEGRYSSTYEIVFHGELSAKLRAQAGVEHALNCNETTGSCVFRYRFEELNDYTDRAEPGHVAVSFRTDEAESDRFRGFARNIERFSSDGPLQCEEVAGSHCVSIYGDSCTTPLRCRVRLPDGTSEAPASERTEPVVASELVKVDSTQSGLQVIVMGEMAELLQSQPGVANQLVCDEAEDSCAFRARFERVNDYTDRAEAGHIAASFRTDETDSDSFRRFAGGIERFSNGGPLECSGVETRCIALYGPCNTHYRCGLRLPE